MPLFPLLMVLAIVYFVGKYIAATGTDAGKKHTAQFGNNLATASKNIGCFLLAIIAIIIGGGAILVLKFLL